MCVGGVFISISLENGMGVVGWKGVVKQSFSVLRSLGNIFSYFSEEQTQPQECKYLTEGHTVQLYYSYLHRIPGFVPERI